MSQPSPEPSTSSCAAPAPERQGGVLIVDFGAQYCQLIARRVRELSVYSRITVPERALFTAQHMRPAAVILSGGPRSVYEHDAPALDPAQWPGAAQALEHVGLPEAQLNLAQAAIYLARAPKSNASAVAIWEARQDVREHGNARPPAMLRSTGHKGAAKARGHGEGYAYPHEDPAGFEVSYLPEELQGRRYYRPTGEGEEATHDGEDR